MELAREPPCSDLMRESPATNWSGETLWNEKPAVKRLKVAVLGVCAGVAGCAEGERSELVELVRLRTDLPLGSILTSWSTKSR